MKDHESLTDTYPTAILARQPIFDYNLRVFAYELLFRNSSTDFCANINADAADMATAKVINFAFLEIGMDRVLGDHTGFINLTRNFLLSDDPFPLAKEKVVLEILEDIEPDEEIIAAVKNLVKQGYVIALDDFIFSPKLEPLVELATIIKVDILAMTDEELADHVHILRKYPVKLLAEKVETNAQFNYCRKLGFDLFQGYFFSKPSIIEDKVIPARQQQLLNLIARLQDPDIEFDEIERLISQDPALLYKLTRLLNSAAVGLNKHIDSVKHALVFLGINAIKTWTTIIAMNEIDAIPDELMTMALVRGKMCEKIAPAYGYSENLGFLVGLFSNLDSMLQRPMDELLKGIPLNDEIVLALTNHGGLLGKMLDDVVAYKTGHWDCVNTDFASLEAFANIYMDAVEWANLTNKGF